MAIKLNIGEGHPNLFCDSKWWGDPDMPEDMEYPMLDGYPLTFLCQINLDDIAGLDQEELLPHNGMLYFFAAADGLFGYDVPVDGPGDWPKGHAVVKYTKEVNMETFKSVIQLDQDGVPTTAKALPLSLESCDDDFGGLRMLGNTPSEGDEFVTLLQIPLDPKRTMLFKIKKTDLGFGNWKKTLFSLIEIS